MYCICVSVGKKMRERNISGGMDSKGRTSSTASDLGTMTSSGGLSITGCLTDFSLYIFHPYGGGQKKAGIPTSPRYLGKQFVELYNLVARDQQSNFMLLVTPAIENCKDTLNVVPIYPSVDLYIV